MDDRPRGSTMLGVIAILGGCLHFIPNALLLLGGVLGIFGGMYTTTGQAGAPASDTGVLLVGLGLVGVFAAVLLIVAGISVLQLSSWAWPLAVIAACVALVGAAVRLIVALSQSSAGNQSGLPVRVVEPFGRGFKVVKEGIAVILCVVALVYLLIPSIREAFGRDADTTASL